MSEFVYKFGKPMNFMVHARTTDEAFALTYTFNINFSDYSEYYKISLKFNIYFTTKDLIMGIMRNNWKTIYKKLCLPRDSDKPIKIHVFDGNNKLATSEVKGVSSMDFVLTD